MEDNALELAALYEHFEIFTLKKIRLDPENPKTHELLRYACYAENSKFMQKLLDQGFSPDLLNDNGTSLIQTLIQSMSSGFNLHSTHFGYLSRSDDRHIDTSSSREKIKMIHMLARDGAKWLPNDKYIITDARRSFLKMGADYIAEFVWIMSKYMASTPEILEDLIRTPSIQKHISNQIKRIKELINDLKSLNTV